MSRSKQMPTAEQALVGRDEPVQLDFTHAEFGVDMRAVPTGCQRLLLGLGCFWGAERLFWSLSGVKNTAVGFAGGFTKNPTYDEVCAGVTAHTEVVQVDYDPEEISLAEVLKVFWEAHDPTQGMQQGNDVGTQYRSAIYLDEAQLEQVEASKRAYQEQLTALGRGQITTEIKPMPEFYFAEQYHQQYLLKNPNGYCGLKGTGVVCPI